MEDLSWLLEARNLNKNKKQNVRVVVLYNGI